MDRTSVYIFSTLNESDKTRLSSDVFGKARKGDQGAFGEIYNQFFKKIFRFIFFRVNHKEAAEDLTEEVFLKAYVKIASVRDELAFEGWLYQIARNAVIDYYREKKIVVALEDVENILEYESNFIDVLNLGQDQKLLMKLLMKLPPEQQIVLKLKFLEDLENEVIAEMLHKSEGAIRVIQHRAITKLQQLFKNHGQSN
jgi:RNA polymerase sigma-70 factor (ECF subfamily)